MRVHYTITKKCEKCGGRSSELLLIYGGHIYKEYLLLRSGEVSILSEEMPHNLRRIIESCDKCSDDLMAPFRVTYELCGNYAP